MNIHKENTKVKCVKRNNLQTFLGTVHYLFNSFHHRTQEFLQKKSIYPTCACVPDASKRRKNFKLKSVQISFATVAQKNRKVCHGRFSH